MKNDGYCPMCKKPSSSLLYVGDVWSCRYCLSGNSHTGCRLFEMGAENPADPKGSTAHVRDIKDRRWHPKEKRMFYYSKEMGKSYFFPK